MSDTGFELRSDAQWKTSILSTSAADSDAVQISAVYDHAECSQTEAENVSASRLAVVSELWSMVPAEVQADVVAMVRDAVSSPIPRRPK